MRLHRTPALIGLIFFAMNVPAHGFTCYQIWDDRDTLIYQSAIPPFDLSTPAFNRSMGNLRAQRGQLIFFESRECAIAGSGIIGPQSAASRDPASLLVDIRNAVDPNAFRGGMLSPVPAAAMASPMATPGATVNARPATGTAPGTSPRRY